MNKNDYIIDFDRVNQLTTSIYDDPNDKSNPFVVGKFTFSVSRKFIKEYIDIFHQMYLHKHEQHRTGAEYCRLFD